MFSFVQCARVNVRDEANRYTRLACACAQHKRTAAALDRGFASLRSALALTLCAARALLLRRSSSSEGSVSVDRVRRVYSCSRRVPLTNIARVLSVRPSVPSVRVRVRFVRSSARPSANVRERVFVVVAAAATPYSVFFASNATTPNQIAIRCCWCSEFSIGFSAANGRVVTNFVLCARFSGGHDRPCVLCSVHFELELRISVKELSRPHDPRIVVGSDACACVCV